MIGEIMTSFMRIQKEAEERFEEREEERWRRETELEEHRRREDREHELQVLQLLMQQRPQSQPQPQQHYPHTLHPYSMYSFGFQPRAESPLPHHSPTHSPTPYDD